MNKTGKLTVLSILTSLAIVLHILEAFLPTPTVIPGVKLGLANVITLWTIYSLGFSASLTVTTLRCVLASLLMGSFLTVNFLLSLVGGLCSACVMMLGMKLLPQASPVGISILGAISHNLAQLCVAALLVEQMGIVFYLPILLFSAIPAGIVTGVLTKILLKRVPFGKIK